MGNRSFGLCFARQGVSIVWCTVDWAFWGTGEDPSMPYRVGAVKGAVERPGAKE